MDSYEAECVKRNEKVGERLADTGKELTELERRSTKAEQGIRSNQTAIETSREEMEAGFSEVKEKQRVNEQIHQAIKQDLTGMQATTQEQLAVINDRISEIGAKLEQNSKEHEKFTSDINMNKVKLTNYAETTRVELDSMTKEHAELKDCHERLSAEVEEHNKLERENQLKTNKNLRDDRKKMQSEMN